MLIISSDLSIRYKISAPANQFTTASRVTGGTTTANATGTAGLNVLLHGDGGTSFFDFPTQLVYDNFMGVVILAPNKNLFWGGGIGLNQTGGVAHAAAVNSLIQNQLSQDVAFILEMSSSQGIRWIPTALRLLRPCFWRTIQDRSRSKLRCFDASSCCG